MRLQECRASGARILGVITEGDEEARESVDDAIVRQSMIASLDRISSASDR